MTEISQQLSDRLSCSFTKLTTWHSHLLHADVRKQAGFIDTSLHLFISVQVCTAGGEHHSEFVLVIWALHFRRTSLTSTASFTASRSCVRGQRRRQHRPTFRGLRSTCRLLLQPQNWQTPPPGSCPSPVHVYGLLQARFPLWDNKDCQ